jgi:phosphatidylserine decarboxylase
MQQLHKVVLFSRMVIPRVEKRLCMISMQSFFLWMFAVGKTINNKIQIQNDVSKAKIVKQLQLFSMHSHDSAISVHVFA